MSASWPTSVATDANLSVAVNSLQTTLASGIDAAVTTIPLVSTTGFPTAGYVTIDNEVLSYTGVSGGNLTGATRGADGTTAATHNSGAAVSATIVAAHHNSLKDEVKAVETYLSANLGTGAQPLANGHRALASNASGKIVEATTTDTELGFVSGVTSAIQTQIAAQMPKTGGQFTGGVSFDNYATHGITGTATNDSAPANVVGEYISASAAVSAVSLSSATAANVTSISLSAGDWDVSGVVVLSPSGTTTYTQIYAAISSTSATLPSTSLYAGWAGSTQTPPALIGTTVATQRFSLSTTTTIYLVAQCSFGVSTMTAGGFLRARRMR